MLVLQKHNAELTDAAGEAFYTLVCLHQVKLLNISVSPHFNLKISIFFPGKLLIFHVLFQQAEYLELVETLLSSQQDPVIYQRLADAFNNLTGSSTPPTLDRKQRMAFLKSLKDFMANVGGLLCVK